VWLLADGVVDIHAQMWIDRRGNWHIIGHAYNTAEVTHCARSALSTHFFSRRPELAPDYRR